jgi:hypothetical protein
MNLNQLNANTLNVNPLQQWMLYQQMLNNPNLLNSPSGAGIVNINPANVHQFMSNVSCAYDKNLLMSSWISPTYQNHQSDMPMSAMLNPLLAAHGPGLQTGLLQPVISPVISPGECVEV